MKLTTLVLDVKNFLLLGFSTLKIAIMEILNKIVGSAFLILGFLVFAVSIIIGTFDLIYFHLSRNYFNREQQNNHNSQLPNFGK